MKMDPYLIQKLTQIKNLNGELKLLEENIGEKLLDVGLGNYFLYRTPKAQTTQEKIDKLNYIKI